MGSMNRVFLMGNLTRDPELKQLPSGMAVADMGMAVNEKFKGKDGELVETTCFVDVSAFGRQAEACGQYLKKGAPVLVEGRLKYDTWESDGQKRSKIRVRADRVQFVGRAKSENDAGNGNGNGNAHANGGNEDGEMPF
jgi:single-strand DNA-binding protein